ncbi:cytochrome p450 [Stylonychia lemnae]|uniref:Cytochrome p450 n=1 Tax=Stylonychia lemnae TaxID=5949 RepID=A0A078AG61_STYLE|nr:cytochrome p450 [Stylonychia lemnae]|eukprot:CDW81214.1 cytochrome p450 [Stylonychia lemnae]
MIYLVSLPIVAAIVYICYFIILKYLKIRFYEKQGVRFCQGQNIITGHIDRLQQLSLKDPYTQALRTIVNEDFKDKEHKYVGILLGTKVHLLVKDITFIQTLYEQNKVKYDKDPMMQTLTLPLGETSNFVPKTTDYWKKIRPAITQALYSQDRTKLYEVIRQKMQIVIESQTLKTNKIYNVLPEISKLMESAISITFYEDDLSQVYIDQMINGQILKKSVSESILAIFKEFITKGQSKLNLYFPYLAQKGFGLATKDQLYNIQNIRHYFLEQISKLRTQKVEYNQTTYSFVRNLSMHKELTDIQVADELMLLLVGALDNTVSSIINAIQLLHLNSQAYQKLMFHIKNSEFENQIEFARECFLESLRMYSPNPYIPGIYIQNQGQIGDINIKKGDVVMVDIDFIHYHESIWQRPFEYLPERFNYNSHLYLQPNGKKRSVFNYVPFGFGKRICPGADFIENAGSIFLIEMLKKYKFTELKEPRFSNLFQILKPEVVMMVTKNDL